MSLPWIHSSGVFAFKIHNISLKSPRSLFCAAGDFCLKAGRAARTKRQESNSSEQNVFFCCFSTFTPIHIEQSEIWGQHQEFLVGPQVPACTCPGCLVLLIACSPSTKINRPALVSFETVDSQYRDVPSMRFPSSVPRKMPLNICTNISGTLRLHFLGVNHCQGRDLDYCRKENYDFDISVSFSKRRISGPSWDILLQEFRAGIILKWSVITNEILWTGKRMFRIHSRCSSLSGAFANGHNWYLESFLFRCCWSCWKNLLDKNVFMDTSHCLKSTMPNGLILHKIILE